MNSIQDPLSAPRVYVKNTENKPVAPGADVPVCLPVKTQSIQGQSEEDCLRETLYSLKVLDANGLVSPESLPNLTCFLPEEIVAVEKVLSHRYNFLGKNDFSVVVSAKDILTPIYERFRSYIDSVLIVGGGVNSLLSKGYFERNLSAIGVEPSKSALLDGLLEKLNGLLNDLDLRIIFNEKSNDYYNGENRKGVNGLYEDLRRFLCEILASKSLKKDSVGFSESAFVWENAFKKKSKAQEPESYSLFSLKSAEGFRLELLFSYRLNRQFLFINDALAIKVDDLLLDNSSKEANVVFYKDKGWSALLGKLLGEIGVIEPETMSILSLPLEHVKKVKGLLDPYANPTNPLRKRYLDLLKSTVPFQKKKGAAVRGVSGDLLSETPPKKVSPHPKYYPGIIGDHFRHCVKNHLPKDGVAAFFLGFSLCLTLENHLAPDLLNKTWRHMQRYIVKLAPKLPSDRFIGRILSFPTQSCPPFGNMAKIIALRMYLHLIGGITLQEDLSLMARPHAKGVAMQIKYNNNHLSFFADDLSKTLHDVMALPRDSLDVIETLFSLFPPDWEKSAAVMPAESIDLIDLQQKSILLLRNEKTFCLGYELLLACMKRNPSKENFTPLFEWIPEAVLRGYGFLIKALLPCCGVDFCYRSFIERVQKITEKKLSPKDFYVEYFEALTLDASAKSHLSLSGAHASMQKDLIVNKEYVYKALFSRSVERKDAENSLGYFKKIKMAPEEKIAFLSRLLDLAKIIVNDGERELLLTSVSMEMEQTAAPRSSSLARSQLFLDCCMEYLGLDLSRCFALWSKAESLRVWQLKDAAFKNKYHGFLLSLLEKLTPSSPQAKIIQEVLLVAGLEGEERARLKNLLLRGFNQEDSAWLEEVLLTKKRSLFSQEELVDFKLSHLEAIVRSTKTIDLADLRKTLPALTPEIRCGQQVERIGRVLSELKKKKSALVLLPFFLCSEVQAFFKHIHSIPSSLHLHEFVLEVIEELPKEYTAAAAKALLEFFGLLIPILFDPKGVIGEEAGRRLLAIEVINQLEIMETREPLPKIVNELFVKHQKDFFSCLGTGELGLRFCKLMNSYGVSFAFSEEIKTHLFTYIREFMRSIKCAPIEVHNLCADLLQMKRIAIQECGNAWIALQQTLIPALARCQNDLQVDYWISQSAHKLPMSFILLLLSGYFERGDVEAAIKVAKSFAGKGKDSQMQQIKSLIFEELRLVKPLLCASLLLQHKNFFLSMKEEKPFIEQISFLIDSLWPLPSNDSEEASLQLLRSYAPENFTLWKKVANSMKTADCPKLIIEELWSGYHQAFNKGAFAGNKEESEGLWLELLTQLDRVQSSLFNELIKKPALIYGVLKGLQEAHTLRILRMIVYNCTLDVKTPQANLNLTRKLLEFLSEYSSLSESLCQLEDHWTITKCLIQTHIDAQSPEYFLGGCRIYRMLLTDYMPQGCTKEDEKFIFGDFLAKKAIEMLLEKDKEKFMNESISYEFYLIARLALTRQYPLAYVPLHLLQTCLHFPSIILFHINLELLSKWFSLYSAEEVEETLLTAVSDVQMRIFEKISSSDVAYRAVFAKYAGAMLADKNNEAYRLIDFEKLEAIFLYHMLDINPLLANQDEVIELLVSFRFKLPRRKDLAALRDKCIEKVLDLLLKQLIYVPQFVFRGNWELFMEGLTVNEDGKRTVDYKIAFIKKILAEKNIPKTDCLAVVNVFYWLVQVVIQAINTGEVESDVVFDLLEEVIFPTSNIYTPIDMSSLLFNLFFLLRGMPVEKGQKISLKHAEMFYRFALWFDIPSDVTENDIHPWVKFYEHLDDKTKLHAALAFIRTLLDKENFVSLSRAMVIYSNSGVQKEMREKDKVLFLVNICKKFALVFPKALEVEKKHLYVLYSHLAETFPDLMQNLAKKNGAFSLLTADIIKMTKPYVVNDPAYGCLGFYAGLLAASKVRFDHL